MFHSGVFAVIMSAIVALQYLSPPEKEAEERGIAAAFVPALASIQTKVLPLPENQRLLLQFQNAIGSGGDSERLARSEEHTSELQSLMRISYAVFCLKKKTQKNKKKTNQNKP